MAKHLDLEEQEQLDEIKHFWKEYGNLITWVLIAVFGAIAAWNGWQYWQRTQAVQAATLYDEVERAAQAGDTARVERAFSDMKDKFGSTTYAQQAGMLAAKVLVEKGNTDAAKAALAWVAEKSSDEGYQAVARLRTGRRAGASQGL
jgi:predicted negative regulator of RcsB-dependent stress response